jgi:glucuronate isomerase
MKKFMDENFLLQTETAQKLYHEHAKKMPIAAPARTSVG